MSKRFPIGQENWYKRGLNSHKGTNSKSGKGTNKTQTYTYRPRQPRTAEFIGIDGEGYTDENGNHRYFLLAASDGRYVSNPQGLSTVECFDFLFETKTSNPHYVFVCYGASYDINMMLRSAKQATVDFIYRNSGAVYIEGKRYWIRYTPHKMLQISRWVNDKRESVTLYDCIGFFQQPFVDAIEEWLGKDYDGLPTIRDGKARRSQFMVGEFETILQYCQTELSALVLLMSAVRDSLRYADVRISQWYGPGAIASSLLKHYNVKRHMRDTYHLDRPVYEAAQRAFAGGRIELLQYGMHNGPVYHYDLNSAYPSVIADLPGMDTVTWHHISVGISMDDLGGVANLALYHIKWQANNDAIFYPFHYRNPHGLIYFPAFGEGWYWGVEVNAAQQYFNGDIEILECYWPQFKKHTKPFKWVRELYEQRKVWKREGNAAHRTIKLGLNSLYGKLIQHVGGDEFSNRLPAFHQLEWAGFITASTRAKLYTAGMQNQDSIIAFQTDGIFSTKPLDLQFGDALGEWTEEPICSKGLFVQSGIYWIWEQESRNKISNYRGFDSGSLTPQSVLNGWKESMESITAPSTRFTTMGSALANRWEQWCTWRTIERELQLTPKGTKRMDYENVIGNPSKELIPTLTNEFFLRRGISEKYGLPWEKWDYEHEYVDGIRERDFEDEHEETYV